MALFKKPNRKFRQRVTHNDSEEEDLNTEANEAKDKKIKSEAKEKLKTSTVENKEKISAANNLTSNVLSKEGSSKDKDEKIDLQQGRPVTKLLSFHDEEDDGEVFKVKKSNHSRRLAKLLEKERKKRQENPELGSAFEENQEVKLEIKNEPQSNDQPQLPKSIIPQYFPEGWIRLKNEKEAWDILNGKDAEDMEVESDDENKDGQAENPFKDVLKSGVIPDAATIYAMKKHRQMAREMGDFIPVDDTERTEESKSRLVREDDNDRSDDDDDDDEPSRLSFTVNTGAVERQKVREAFLSVQEGCQAELENDEADELERWEREQIRKGVSIAQVGQQQHQQLEKQIFPYQTNIAEKPVFTARMPDKEDNLKCTVKLPPYPKEDKINLTTGIIKTRLQERLTSLDEVHRAHQQELETCRSDLESAYKLIKQLEEEGPALADRFSLYQQMRGYVKDLVECLDFKVAHIELLEGKIMDLFKLRAERLIYRRQQDIRDQADEYSMLSSKVLRGSSVDILNEKNSCTDEIKLRRIAEREGRRMRRRKFRESQQSSIKHHEGMSSDDEEPEIDILKFRNKKESILDEADTIFEDVVEEFGTIQGLKTGFERWRKEQKESYCDAFVPLCLPKIFGPFIRVELMDWNPLENNKDLERMPWYDCLVFYGWNEDEIVDTEEKEDADTNLLPGIIEKIVLSKITAFIQNVWDPMSTRETLNLVSLIKKLFEDYPTVNGKSKQTQALLQAVCTRIYKSLDDDVFIPLYPKELLENRSLGSSTFFQRQFWASVKLLRNILSWHGVIAEQPLQDMALASLLNRYLLMGLLTSLHMKDTFDKCRMIVATFPRAWFSNLKGSSTLPQLKKFSQFLLQFAQQLHSQYIKRGQDESDAKDAVKEIGQMLVTMGALEEAVTLGKQFSISFIKNSVSNKC